jgi:hypothetical protein
MAAPRFQDPGHLYLLGDTAMATLFIRFTREELEALDDDDLEHIEKIQGPFSRIWAREVNESGRFNFRIQLTEAEIMDVAHDFAARLKDVHSKIRSYYMDAWRDHLCLACKECEDSSGFRTADDADLIVRHIMEEHPPPPLVKSAKKC